MHCVLRYALLVPGSSSPFYLILFSFKDANVVLEDKSLCACLSKLSDDGIDDAGGGRDRWWR